MRRRLNFLVLAVTSFVVVVYTVPLGLLVDRQAEEAARTGAERLVQAAASQVVEAVAATQTADLESIAGRLSLPSGVVVESAAGEILGEGVVGTSVATEALRTDQAASAEREDGGWEVALPVITFADTLVVHTVVPAEDRNRGVARAWAFLAILGVMVNGAAVGLADRLGRTLRDPVQQLAAAAARIGGGDLDTRVGTPDIEELRVVAEALNGLAPRLRDLLDEERESAADLSHRLRTPLAALRLQAESLPVPERDPMVGLVDRMQESVDRLIADMRRADGHEPSRTADLAAVADRHSRFWAVLAEEQGRSFRSEVAAGPLPVAATESELGDLVDTLVANVFSHTEPGTDFRLLVTTTALGALVHVSDGGPGFPAGLDPFERGRSGGGSTGLGLDIARRLAERTGGAARASNAAAGGAVVEVEVPLVVQQPPAGTTVDDQRGQVG